MKKLAFGVLALFYTLNLKADISCQDILHSQDFIKLCAQIQTCPPSPLLIKSVTPKKKKRKKKIAAKAAQPAPVGPVVSAAVPPIADIVVFVPVAPEDDFWLQPFLKIGFSQFNLDSNIGSTRIISREENEFGVKAKFSYAEVNPFVKFSLRHIELEAPANQSFDHGSDNLYNLSFGVEKQWERFSLLGSAGYKHELYFRGYNTPTISVDKFFVPFAEIDAKYKLINGKSFNLSAIGLVGYDIPFKAHLSGANEYSVEGSLQYNYGIEFSKQFKRFSLGASIVSFDKNKSSDQGKQKDEGVDFKLNIEIPFAENF